MTNDDILRQQMLELIHGLLDDEEEERQLLERISSDPEVARTYAEVSTEAEILARAARLEGAKIPLPKRRVTRGSAARSTPTAYLPWLVGLAASLLVLTTIGGYVYDRVQSHDVAADHLRLVVAAPAALAPGVDGRLTIRTESATGRPLPADINISLVDRQERQLIAPAEGYHKLGSDGRIELPIPAAGIVGPVRLEVQAYNRGGRPAQMTRWLDVEPEHFVTQLALDKPWYQPGETVYFRSLTLENFSLASKREVQVEFEILDPAGSPVAGSKSSGFTQHGVGNGSFALGSELAGGMYTLVTRSIDQPPAFAEQKKEFLVQRYQLPRLKKDLEFTRDSYAPGDEVVADFSVNRAEGGPAVGAKLHIVATVDGQTVFEKDDAVSPTGTFQVHFALPKTIEQGEGQLAVIVDDGGTRETSAKTIPINLGKVAVDFYPEGGDLVAGVDNRVYFAARDPVGEPVHIEGQIVDRDGHEVAKVTTVHDGRGSFSLKPEKDQQYTLKITKPEKVENAPKLPAVNPIAPVVLSTGAGVVAAKEPLKLNITSTKDRLPLAITANCRGLSVGQTTLVTDAAGRSADVTLALAEPAEGVIRVTVYDYSGAKPVPVAERLVYRRPVRKLSVGLAQDNYKLSPGQKAEVRLKVTDEHGRGVPATLGVAVVDDALLAMANADTKHKPAAMPTHFYLASEIDKPEELENVNFYLSDDPKAAETLDLLLGTQGWRRFVDRRLDELKGDTADAKAAREAIERLLAATGPAGPPAVFDNLSQIIPAYEANLAEYQTEQAARRATIGRISFFGGVGLLVVVALLGLARLASSPRAWIPSLVGATACLVVGGLWMSAEMRKTPTDNLAMFRADDVRQIAQLHDLDENDRGRQAAENPSDLAGIAFAEQVDDVAPHPRAAPLPVLGDLSAIGAAFRDDKVDLQQMQEKQRLEKRQIADEKLANQMPLAPAKAVEMRLNDDLARQDELRAEAGIAAPLRRVRVGTVYLAILRRRMRQAELEGKNAEAEKLAQEIRQLTEHTRFPVRQYAHQHVAGTPGVRSDFTETLYWNPIVITDPHGQATIRFDLSDAVTTFRVVADAHSADERETLGRIGTGGGEIVSRIPFSIEPKLPLEVNAGDRIDLPVAIVNDTADGMTVALALQPDELLSLAGEATRKLDLTAAARTREFFPLTVVGQNGEAKLRLSGTAGALADSIEKKIKVVPPGFPVSESYAGRLDDEEKVTVTLPKDWVPGSLVVSARAYPTTLADMQAGLESIFQEPCGCFEQASMSNYPNVLIMNYMREHRVADPAITRRARDLMKSGYARLTGYECKQKGYEWFGGDPGHEALSAYGLMQFRDMANVYEVDPEMVERTAAWLMARRDGKGGFQRNPRALDSFGGAPPDVTNAYIVWALTESGQKEIDKELEFAVDLGRKSDDPYIVALAGASAVNYGQERAGRELLKKLAGLQQADGHLMGKQGSITRSGGESLKVETTALSALAWLKLPKFTPQANKAVDWIVKSRQGAGGFGSTQATILALKTLVTHAKANEATVGGGELIVLRDDEEIGRATFAAGERNAVAVMGLEEKLKPGDNHLTLKLTGENKMPYAVEVNYRTLTPVSQPGCPVRLETKLNRESVAAGGTVALSATLENTTDQGQPMTVAILGIPGGTRPRTDQLEELKKNKTIDYYETRAREVICYWRALAPKRKVDLRLDLIAEIPGRYTAPASRAYLYYTAEEKQWVDPVSLEIGKE